jgi:hypothetical protein
LTICAFGDGWRLRTCLSLVNRQFSIVNSKIFTKKLSTKPPLVIGFKTENPAGPGEDGQAVKLELWVVEKGGAALLLHAILAALKEARIPRVSVLKKAQVGRPGPPIHSLDLKSEELRKVPACPCAAEGEYFKLYNQTWNKRNTLALISTGAFFGQSFAVMPRQNA